MKLQTIDDYINESKKPNIPDGIKSLIDGMISGKVYKKIIKIKDESKHKLFMKENMCVQLEKMIFNILQIEV